LFRLVYEELDLSVTALLRNTALPSLVAREEAEARAAGAEGSLPRPRSVPPERNGLDE
jgi:hypothetical protein